MRINALIRPDPVPHAARDAGPLLLPAAAPADNHASPAPFANLLRQTQAAPAAQAPKQPPAPSAEPKASADAPSPAPEGDGNGNGNANDNAAAEAGATAKAHAPTRPKLRGPDRVAAPAHPPPRAEGANGASRGDAAKAATENATPTPTDIGGDTANANATPSLDPALVAWLAAPPAASVSPRGEGHATRSGGEPAVSSGSNPSGNPPSSAGDLQAALSDKPERAALGKARAALPGTDTPSVAARTDSTGAHPSQATAVPAERSDPLPGLNAALFNPAPTGLRDVPPPAAVALATPVDAPEFGKMLGLQMSVLVQDGVQQAELHLNPADMGPVSVQIVMDGTRAQVDFGADVAATRQAIEAGLPALASALRDAGFTLAGGGVSQHSRGRSDSSDARSQAVSGARGARRRADDAQRDIEAAARTATRRTVRMGGLDLYA